jgi:hypothetical protein
VHNGIVRCSKLSNIRKRFYFKNSDSGGFQQNSQTREVTKKCPCGNKTHKETQLYMKRKFVARSKNTMHVLASPLRGTSPLYWLTANLLIKFISYRVKSHSFFSLDVCPICFLHYKLLRNNSIPMVLPSWLNRLGGGKTWRLAMRSSFTCGEASKAASQKIGQRRIVQPPT